MTYDLAKWAVEARKRAGMTQEQFAFELGFSTKASVNAIEKGRNKPTFETMVKISEISGFPLPYLTVRSSENHSDDLETARLDLYDVSASCGSGHLNVDYPELLHSLEIPKTALKELLGTDNLHGVKLMSPDGDSMEPTIPPKSITLIKTDVAEFESSGVYLFTFQGYTYIKRLARGKAGVIHVTSDNPIYSKSDFVIEPEEFDDLFIHGKFWKVLPLDFLDI
ncbi:MULTISPECIES: helix-turn-helix domain-containing protein [Neisseria]|uniref:helix-turn-helix domain-containing protein n=1 Tax=Neisseria TaxID=482 RepID=UPI000B1875BF|nr:MULTISPECIES: helix-turn-helix domain-containing protein [Neisseria]